MKFLPRLALTTASIALTFVSVSVKSASAAIINYSFKINTPVTQGSGFFSFDDATFSNESIPVAPVRSLSFTFNDNPLVVYTEKDDIDYPSLGPIVFQNVAGNSPFGLSYLFNDKSNPLNNYVVDGYDFIANDQAFTDTVTYAPVPEPTTLGGTFIACSIGYFINRKTKSAMKLKA